MGNLAFKLISAGFLPEAKQCCDLAVNNKDCDKHVFQALTRLKNDPEEEDKKEQQIILEAEPIDNFYADYGRAVSLPKAQHLPVRLKKPDSNYLLSVVLKESVFMAKAFYEVAKSEPSSPFLLSAFPGLKKKAETTVTKYHIEYEGRLQGCAIEGTVTIRELDEDEMSIRSLLGHSGDKKTKVLMIISDDRTECRVMERDTNANPVLYTLKSFGEPTLTLQV